MLFVPLFLVLSKKTFFFSLKILQRKKNMNTRHLIFVFIIGFFLMMTLIFNIYQHQLLIIVIIQQHHLQKTSSSIK
jgi:hypothetical protein